MKSKILFFNPVILRKDLTGFCPLWGWIAIENLVTGRLDAREDREEDGKQ